jgi:ATP-dependent DNA helicase RecG
LLIRGPGELLGVRQSGLPALRFANLEEDMDVLRNAKQVAIMMLDKHPDLATLHTKLWFSNQSHLLKA